MFSELSCSRKWIYIPSCSFLYFFILSVFVPLWNGHKQNGLFRNEIFISNTFIILLPSLNIYFTNVWESKGRIHRIVFVAKVVDIDFWDGLQIWPSLDDPLVMFARYKVKQNQMVWWKSTSCFKLSYDILLFGDILLLKLDVGATFSSLHPFHWPFWVLAIW